MISKIELKCFQKALTLKLFMCLKLELLELILKFYLLGISFFFKLFIIVFWQDNFICIFSIFFQTRIAKLRKFKPEKHVHLGEARLIQLFKPKISTIFFSFTKKIKC
jgi:hypothetical protein